MLDQNFEADAPNVKWVTDITCLPVDHGWVYLAVVLDLFSRRVIGWSMSGSLATPLVSEALKHEDERVRAGAAQVLANIAASELNEPAPSGSRLARVFL